jgi:hypothetical protein
LISAGVGKPGVIRHDLEILATGKIRPERGRLDERADLSQAARVARSMLGYGR